MEQNVDVQEIIKEMRESIANLSQENAILKAYINTISKKEKETTAES